MRTIEKEYSPERVELKGFLAEFRDALEEEIDRIKKSGQTSTLLTDGRQIQSQGAELYYRFSVEYAPALPADTPCKLYIGREQFDVTVVGFDENSIILFSQKSLPDTIQNARLENGATVLMERLIKCIEENAEKENPAGNRMLPSDGVIYSAKKIFEYDDLALGSQNVQSQNDAISSALSNDITYIWGPPGTGKTTVIGQIIDELYKRERSVLIVSHTNTAVDGAIEKADKAYLKANHNKNEKYPILRIGNNSDSLPERVTLDSHVYELGKELHTLKTILEKEQEKLKGVIKKIRLIISKDTWVKETNLDDIKRVLESIDIRENELAEIQRRIDALNVYIRKEKAAHPEYASYLTLEKSLEVKKNNFNNICEQIESAESAIAALPGRIQAAQDEKRKHSMYSQLLAEEAKFMSSSFISTQIDKANAQISLLENAVSDLISQQKAAQKVIAEYENKGSFAKLFSVKTPFTQAQATISHIQQALPNTRDDLAHYKLLKESYSKQLADLSIIQEQLRAVTPSRTPDYWSREISKLKTELDNFKNALPRLSDKKTALYEKVCKLEEHKNQAKTAYDALNELNAEIQREQEKQIAAKQDYDKKSQFCSEMLEYECRLCPLSVYKSDFNDNTALFNELSTLYRAVKNEISSFNIEAKRKEEKETEQQLTEISRQLTDVTQKMQELEKEAIMNAKIIGTTLAKSYLSETLRKRNFDTVILDEASMASIPALWCASYLAKNNIVIVGDFLQLPPIVMANTPMAQKWLGKDIFYHSGMQKQALDKANCPKNFVMLNNQFRMEKEIAEIANMYYGNYGGLISDDNNANRVKLRKEFESWYSWDKTNKSVHLIDTESLHAWVTGVPQGKGHSRLNCFSAAVCVDLAFSFIESKIKNLTPSTATPAKEPSVLIVTPYKPHTTRITQLIDLEYRNCGFKKNLEHIKAGTIHSFQGSEADIVIFDLVIDEPHWKANLFLTDKEVNDSLKKMFNVAVTRARFKLFVVGNFAYCQKRAKNNALSDLLDSLLKDRVKIEAKTLLPNIVFAKQSSVSLGTSPNGKHIICREDSFSNYFMADIQSFKTRLIVYSPFITEARLSTLLPAFSDAIRAGKEIIVVTKALSERSKTDLARYQKCESELQAIGANIIHKKGMHEKLILVDSNAVWIGSLNALSFTGLTGEVMQRHEDSKLTADYEKLYNIEHICDAVQNNYELKCPICGNEMLVKESDDGGIYWQCVSGDYSRNAEQQYPLDGVLRCKCGSPYVFAMKNEPRWVCSENPRHFQKMRESDLKLEKMAALIPTKAERKEVDRFFAQKRKERETLKKSETKKKTAISDTSAKKMKNK